MRTVPRVAFYTRISTDEDHQKFSLDAQRDRLEAYCKSQYGDDWTLHKLFRDTESGTHMNRPGLEEMLFDAEARAFDVLLVFRVDRLSRKVRELAQMVDDLTKSGVTLKSITEPFDTSNAAGKMMLQMLGVFAEFEHATIVERTRVGLERKAKTGSYVGGNVPYGYRLDDDKRLLIHEEEALIVRKMFTMYALGREGASTICTKLNDAGLRNRNGRKWGRRVVLYMLKNPVYVGKIRWREVEYQGNHDPIVSDVLFEKAREVPECNTARTATAGRETRRGRPPGWAEPEVVFRIVHVAKADGQSAAAYRDQAVEVALGPNPAFPAGRVGAFTRRVPAERVVTGAPPVRGKPKPAKEPRPPRVAELLRKAQAWRAMLESGEVASQAEIARREGVSRARVTQIMGLLRLAPEIHEAILSMPATTHRSIPAEPALRSVARLADRNEQLREFSALATVATVPR